MKNLTMTGLLLAAAIHFPLSAIAAATLVQDVRVFDGERMHARRSVLIDGAAIVDADFTGPVPAGAKVVSGAGRTLLPGLIDSHVHAYQDLALPLLFGVTTQVDMFTGVPVMQEMTRNMKAGTNTGKADLFSAGTLATAPGGHGTQFGMSIPTLTAPEQAQAFVDARVAEGSHFIKIVMEDGAHGRKVATLDLATVGALIRAAHARGKLAVVHVSTPEHARAALEAGADGLVHLYPGREARHEEIDSLVRLARKRGAFVIPTFCVLESVAGIKADELMGDTSLMALLDKGQRAPLARTYGARPSPEMLAAPRALTLAMRKAGVAVLAGTDAGNAGTQYGVSMHHELLALVQSGLTPVQALAAATSVPARAFKLGQRGRIASGYKADLLLVEGDPGTDIASTRRIVTVWKDGEDAGAQRAAQRERVAQEASAKPQPLVLPADGRISLFSRERLGSPVGAGWMGASDSFMGGKSTVKLQYQESQAGGQGALVVNAIVQPGFVAPWAGVSFMPGKQPMQPADLSGARVIRFKVRGDGQDYMLNVMSQGVQMPASAPFTAGIEWSEVVVPFSSLKGIDAGAITMIAFNAGPRPGSYAFQIADVRLLNE